MSEVQNETDELNNIEEPDTTEVNTQPDEIEAQNNEENLEDKAEEVENKKENEENEQSKPGDPIDINEEPQVDGEEIKTEDVEVHKANEDIDDDEKEKEPTENIVQPQDHEAADKNEEEATDDKDTEGKNMETSEERHEDGAQVEGMEETREEGEEGVQVEEQAEKTSTEIVTEILDDIFKNVYGEQLITEEEKEEKPEETAEEGIVEGDETNADRIEEVEEPPEEDEERLTSGRVGFELPSGDIQEGEEQLQHSEYEEEGEEEEEEEDDSPTREEIMEALDAANKETNDIREKNTALQHKLGDFLRRKKAAEQQGAAQIPQEEKDLIDYESKYNKQIEQIQDMEKELEMITENFELERNSCHTLKTKIENEFQIEQEKLKQYRSSIGLKSINTRTGKRMNIKDIDILFANEQKKEAVVITTRLENIELQNEVDKIKATLQSKEDIANGLHLIDFEQFKIENQSYNEKLEERNEDIMKLRKKITNNVHILTHVKEKMEYTNHEYYKEKEILKELDEELNDKRDKLNNSKKRRDKLRLNIEINKKSCGMLGNTDLLRNYENCSDLRDGKKERLVEMKNKHTELCLYDHTLRTKIENIKTIEHQL